MKSENGDGYSLMAKECPRKADAEKHRVEQFRHFYTRQGIACVYPKAFYEFFARWGNLAYPTAADWRARGA